MKTKPQYIDVSDRALLKMDGPDAVDLLQRISTNDLVRLKVGEHAQTVLTNEKGRIVDTVSVFRTSETTLFLSGCSRGPDRLANWINRFVVMEDVTISSMTGEWVQLLLFNFQSYSLESIRTKDKCFLGELIQSDTRQALLIAGPRERETLLGFLASEGFEEAAYQQWERYRVEHGIPAFPQELCDQFNPLEVGLKDLVSFTKGCYVGQEVIARLDTYDKVHKRIRRLRLSAEPAQLPTELKVSPDGAAGTLTSYVDSGGEDGSFIGLGLVRSDFDGGILDFAASNNGSFGQAVVQTAQ